MTLAGRGVCDKSFQITADFLELIVGCTAGCQLSHRVTRSHKSLSRALFEFTVIMTEIVGLYGLMASVDLLPLIFD